MFLVHLINELKLKHKRKVESFIDFPAPFHEVCIPNICAVNADWPEDGMAGCHYGRIIRPPNTKKCDVLVPGSTNCGNEKLDASVIRKVLKSILLSSEVPIRLLFLSSAQNNYFTKGGKRTGNPVYQHTRSLDWSSTLLEMHWYWNNIQPCNGMFLGISVNSWQSL